MKYITPKRRARGLTSFGMSTRLLLVLTTALLAGALIAPRANADDYVERVYANAAGARHYYLHLPPGDATGKPLMIFLPGCIDPVEENRPAVLPLIPQSDQMGFVLAYPLQDQAANPGWCWNPWNPDDNRRDSGEPSIIAGITTSLIDEFKLDRSRVYVGGYSAGGAMSTVMAAAYPDLYAAAAPLAGTPYQLTGDGGAIIAQMGPRARAVPTFFMQSLFDEASIYPVGRINLSQWLQADNMIDPGSVTPQPTSTEFSGPPQGVPIPAVVERYRSPAGCELAQFWTLTLSEHQLGALLVQQPWGDQFRRDMMTFLLSHSMTQPHHPCG
ncbi:prolyl oligopeptidase family serine peptidase [Nocardia arthritidis]|uniref:Prolyl oligopeptidase family serine peptidase n=2 Tax=Nocardia arthritidis TaxID=228602 RepID=A0A6G9YH69_9NOCA|nr:prolyl oligopeptidase family serine peptidase [Nocardia arthritidis]